MKTNTKFKEWIEDRKYDIDHFFKDIRTFFRSIYQGILNFKYYFRTIYKDRDWDFCYIYYLEYKKLIRMRDYFLVSDIVINSKQIAKEIDLTIKLLDIVMEEDEPYKLYLNVNYSGPINFNKPYNDSDHYVPVYVNMKNLNRFLPMSPEEQKETEDSYLRNPHLYAMEIRKLKARYLYHKLIYERSEGWWD